MIKFSFLPDSYIIQHKSSGLTMKVCVAKGVTNWHLAYKGRWEIIGTGDDALNDLLGARVDMSK